MPHGRHGVGEGQGLTGEGRSNKYIDRTRLRGVDSLKGLPFLCHLHARDLTQEQHSKRPAPRPAPTLAHVQVPSVG